MRYVNIAGAGLAGISAAITLAERGIGSNLISVQNSERAQSVMAEGGINAALDLMGEGDSPEEHCADTLRGGVFLADPNAVAGLCAAAPALLRRLMALGVPFQMEGGRVIQRNFGGQKKKRTAYARSSTGKALMTALIDEARKYEARGLIRRYPHHEAAGLSVSGGCCAGLSFRDSYTGEGFFSPGPVILACGGLNGLLPRRTTGSVANSGELAAAAFALGAEMGNLEFIQYHPTTVAIPGKRLLISEAARGEGGRLYALRGGECWYFMEEGYPELGNLMPRDVVSREMVRVCSRPDCGGQVYLDLQGLSKQVWARRLPDLREELISYLGLDPAKEAVPVSPGIHFFMGGILVDELHRTSIPGLYAAGECACQYHGANRLGGNSTLAAIYGGAVAAKAVSEEKTTDGGGPEPLSAAPEPAPSPGFSARLGDILWAGLPVLREEGRMRDALSGLERLLAEPRTERETRLGMLGKAMLLSAMARKESRGAHTRTDYPERDDARFRMTTVARQREHEIEIFFRALPERRGEESA